MRESKVDNIILFLEDWERLPLALVTMAGPWLTPLVPAYFVAVAINKHLNAPISISIVAGLILELVGIAGIAISTRSYVWNQNKRMTDQPAQFTLSLIAVVIYFATALLLTVLLEFRADLAKIAPGMFVIMAVSSGLILVLSGLQNQRQKEVRIEKNERKQKRKSSGNGSGNLGGNKSGNDYRLSGNSTRVITGNTEKKAVIILAKNPDITGAALGRQLGKSEGRGRQLKRELLPEILNGSGGEK